MRFNLDNMSERERKILALITLIKSGVFKPNKVEKLENELKKLRNNE